MKAPGRLGAPNVSDSHGHESKAVELYANTGEKHVNCKAGSPAFLPQRIAP